MSLERGRGDTDMTANLHETSLKPWLKLDDRDISHFHSKPGCNGQAELHEATSFLVQCTAEGHQFHSVSCVQAGQAYEPGSWGLTSDLHTCPAQLHLDHGSKHCSRLFGVKLMFWGAGLQQTPHCCLACLCLRPLSAAQQ